MTRPCCSSTWRPPAGHGPVVWHDASVGLRIWLGFVRTVGDIIPLVSLRRGAMASVAAAALAPVAGFVSAPLLAQGLGVAGRGESGAAYASLLLVCALFPIGLPESVTHWVAQRRAHGTVKRAAVLLLAFGIVGGCALLVASPALAGGSPTAERAIRLAAIFAPATILGLLARSIALGRQLWGLAALERLITAVSRVGLIAALFLAGSLSLDTAVFVLALAGVLGSVAYLPMIWTKDVGASTGPGIRIAGLLGYGSRFWIGAVSGVLVSRLDQSILLPLSDATQLGLYVVAVSISELPLVVNTALRDLIFSVESENAANDRLALAIRISNSMTVVAGALVAAASALLIRPVFGAEFARALWPAWILLVGVVVGNAGSIAGVAMSARGRPGSRSLALAIALVVNIGALIVLTPRFGAVGAAVATVLANTTAAALNVRALHVHADIRYSALLSPGFGDMASLISTRFGRRSQNDEEAIE